MYWAISPRLYENITSQIEKICSKVCGWRKNRTAEDCKVHAWSITRLQLFMLYEGKCWLRQHRLTSHGSNYIHIGTSTMKLGNINHMFSFKKLVTKLISFLIVGIFLVLVLLFVIQENWSKDATKQYYQLYLWHFYHLHYLHIIRND